MYSEKELKDMISNMTKQNEFNVESIPKYDLLSSQLVSFIQNTFKPEKRTSDKSDVITQTLLQHYNKLDLIDIEKGKKYYSGYHILQIILIHHLKPILTLKDISVLFKSILHDVGNTNDDVIPINKIYETFCSIKRNELEDFCDIFDKENKKIIEEIKGLDIKDDEHQRIAQLFLIVLSLTTTAALQKLMAEKIIDEYIRPNVEHHEGHKLLEQKMNSVTKAKKSLAKSVKTEKTSKNSVSKTKVKKSTK
jgi:hypothetical protein